MERNKRLYYDFDPDIAPIENKNLKENIGSPFSEFIYRGGPGSGDCISSSGLNFKCINSSSSTHDIGNSKIKNGSEFNENNCGDDDVIILQTIKTNNSSNSHNSNSNNNTNDSNSMRSNDNFVSYGDNNQHGQNGSKNNSDNNNGNDNGSVNQGNELNGINCRQYNFKEGEEASNRSESPTLSAAHTARRQSSNSTSGEGKHICYSLTGEERGNGRKLEGLTGWRWKMGS